MLTRPGYDSLRSGFIYVAQDESKDSEFTVEVTLDKDNKLCWPFENYGTANASVAPTVSAF